MSDTQRQSDTPPGQATGQPREAVPAQSGQLARSIGWPHAFWIATGGPALLLFSVGYIASLDGPVSSVVWVVSVLIGLAMAFVYAELAGMFPEKSGGPPVFGAPSWGWKAVGTGWGITLAGVVFYFYRRYTDRRVLRRLGEAGAASRQAAPAESGGG
jgi:hypothetical protein